MALPQSLSSASAFLGLNDPHGLKSLSAATAQHLLLMDTVLRKQFDQYFLQQPYSKLGETFDAPDREDLNCVEALFAAIRDHGYDDGVAMDAQVEDWRSAYPRYLNAWLFGPHGEFTGFARIKALEQTLRREVGKTRRGEVTHVRFQAYAYQITFKVTTIVGFADMMQWHRPLRMDRPEMEAYCQFATYADYAAWESLASHDRTSLHGI